MALVVAATGSFVAVRAFSGRSDQFHAKESRGEEYEGNAFVLDTAERPAILCFGTVADTGVPQCGGAEVSVTNWDWDGVPEVESARGARWGHYHVIGTLDGDAFTLTAPPGEPETVDAESPTACPEPAGGWGSGRPGDTSQADLDAASLYAERQPEFAGAWVAGPDETMAEGGIVLNVAFTGELARLEAGIRKIWAGPLCVVRHERSLRDLGRIHDEAVDVVSDLGLEFAASGTDHVNNQIDMYVVVATERDQGVLDERFGEGAIDLISGLRPVQGQ